MQGHNDEIAVVGAGLIGCSWATVFARAGREVVLHDTDSGKLSAAKGAVQGMLGALQRAGLLQGGSDAIMARISTRENLRDAVADAVLVQECVLETLQAKQAIFESLDALAPPDAILASSTSGITASTFTEGLAGRARCLVGHPLSPPFAIPLVELVPAPWTDAAVVERARALYAAAGQVPILVRREIQGFLVNRLQGALLAEAFRLVEDGYADCAAIDAAVKYGLGLRWAFMGPFETIDLNAPGGVRDYCNRYGSLYYDIARQARPRQWNDALLAQVEQQRQTELPATQRAARIGWRDHRLLGLVRHLGADMADRA